MWPKFAPIVIVLLLCGSAPRLFAQERVEAGIFLDYLGISQTNTNNFGLGARFGYRIHRKVMAEGELPPVHLTFQESALIARRIGAKDYFRVADKSSRTSSLHFP